MSFRAPLTLALLAATRIACAADPSPPTAARLFSQHCQSCHGAERLGGMGPALLPQNLERLKKSEALKVIRQGRPATQMPAFGNTLSDTDMALLADYLYSPPATEPKWTDQDIRASRVALRGAAKLPARPQFKADPKNLFIVVEGGDHHATLLDGDKLEPIHRFATRFALHGGPKFTPDGRFVYFASRDGWISKFDIWNLKTVAEIRAGINTRNVAVSSDGKWVLVGNYLPRTAVLLDADLNHRHTYPAGSGEAGLSRVSAVYDAAPRNSFIIALKDTPAVWELPYPAATRVPGVASIPIPRIIRLDDVLDDFFFDQPYRHMMGASRTGKAQVVDLDQGRKVADLEIAGMPHLGSGITWTWQGTPVLASANLKDGTVSIIDMQDWKTVKTIQTNGPGFFMRSHEKTPYAWIDSMMSPTMKDRLQIIDKQTLEIVAEVRTEPGKTLAHIEFTRDGRFALASLWETDGAIIVFDASTFQEVKRLPMSKPVGKYNVFNKTTRSAGTSH